MKCAYLIFLSDGSKVWAKPPCSYSTVSLEYLRRWIQNGSPLRCQDQRPTLTDLAQPDWGVEAQINYAHVMSIGVFPVV